MANNGVRVIVADDTDIFVLLMHFKHAGRLGNSPIFMESPLRHRSSIDIDLSAMRNCSIVPSLLAAHAVSGCDTVASYFGIGKVKVLKVIQTGNIYLYIDPKLITSCHSHLDDITSNRLITLMHVLMSFPRWLVVRFDWRLNTENGIIWVNGEGSWAINSVLLQPRWRGQHVWRTNRSMEE